MKIAARFTAGHALALTLAWVAALAVTGSTEALLFLAPALLIAIPLLGGRYLGEELIATLAARRRRAPRRPARRLGLAPRPSAAILPRGAALLAFSLAGRPPPGRRLPQT